MLEIAEYLDQYRMNKPLRPILLLVAALLWLANAPRLAAQVGGIAAYEFLNLPNSATVAALGGHHIAVQDHDLSLAARNPALLNAAMHQQLALSHAFHPAGISNSYLAYGHHHERLGMSFHAGLQYANYGGELIRRDETGQEQGTFSANDFAFTLGAAKTFDQRLTLGANLKLINSQLGGYNSFALASDLAAHYQDSSGRFTITLLARNIGWQLGRYATAGNREPMPYELQLGISRELEHLPFRFSIIYRYLDRWNVLFDDPNAPDRALLTLFDEEVSERSAGAIWFDNFFRHFVINGEFMVGQQRNLRLRFGYNHGIKKELSLIDYRSLAGYSAGFSFGAKRFRLAYGRTNYHIGGGINQLGLDISLR